MPYRIKDRPGRRPVAEIRALFEGAVADTPLFARDIPLDSVKQDGEFSHYANEGTDSMWVGFALGCLAIDRIQAASRPVVAQEVRDAALEAAALKCEDIYSWPGAYRSGSMSSSTLKAAAAAIRDMKSDNAATASPAALDGDVQGGGVGAQSRTAFDGIAALASEAYKHWDADHDMKVGKILKALSGALPGYDARADAFHAARDASHAGAAQDDIRLSADHKGMRVDYSGLLKQAQNALAYGIKEPALSEMLRQFREHLGELGQRWYAGDVTVVDEILQLYCVSSAARAAIKAQMAPLQEQGQAAHG